jgi:hypothetical protein
MRVSPNVGCAWGQPLRVASDCQIIGDGRVTTVAQAHQKKGRDGSVLGAGVVGLAAVLLCGGCATPTKTADVDTYTPRIYRTGSNIPLKDYGADNVEVAPPDIVNPVNRPTGFMKPRAGT